MRLSAYEALFFYFLEDLDEDEIKEVVDGWLEDWLSQRKKNI